MPSMRSLRSLRSSLSLATYRSTEPPLNTTSEFTLPTDPRQLAKQIHRDPPSSLPAPGENVHEVRYYLYSLLTVESAGIAKKWPQWVLETCAHWDGDATALRSRSKKDLENICPLNSGHAELVMRGQPQRAPPPACRTAIGNLVSKQVDRLLRLESQRSKVHEDWKRTQFGDRYYAHVDRDCSSLGQPQEWIDPLRRIPSSLQNRNSFTGTIQPQPSCERAETPTSTPFCFPTMGDPMPQWPAPLPLPRYNTQATSRATSMKGNAPASALQDSSMDSPVSSRHESYFSDKTYSTGQSSPPGSVEEHFIQTRQQDERNGEVFGNGSQTSSTPALLSSPLPSHQLPSSSKYSLGGASNVSYGHDNHNVSADLPTYNRQSTILSNSTVTSTNQANGSHANAYHHQVNDTSTRHKSPDFIMLQNPVQQKTRWHRPQNNTLYHGQTTNPSLPALGLQEETNMMLRQFSNPSLVSLASAPAGPTRTGTPLRQPSASLFSDGPTAGSVRSFTFDSVASHSLRSGYPRMSSRLESVPEHPSIKQKPLLSALPPGTTPLRRQNLEKVEEAPPFVIRGLPTFSQSLLSHPNAGVSISSPAPARRSTPGISAMTSRTRSFVGSVAGSVASGFPVRPKKSVPVLNTLASPQRTQTLDNCDKSVFERAAYKSFTRSSSPTSTALRQRVLKREEERMHGMVPSNLVGEGLEHLGPAVRVIDPHTGRPHRTLLEVIREREILNGKRQRGVRGVDGLDSDSPTTDARFTRGC